ncbi:MAG: glucosidase [Rhodothermia bacterium]|nr:glucosidase [Rhodothermia bacterium]
MNYGNNAEQRRLIDSEERRADWKHWGPYVAERAWGTVREDYSAKGDVWRHFPYEHARSRVYRWNEDGLGGFCNRFQNLCLAVAMWNERDPHLKERLFGLDGRQGNHGEDVKEHYFYLDGVPTHAYMKMLYKYPQVAFPYDELRAINESRSRLDPEFELFDALHDTFLGNRYFDVFIEYAKVDEEDILCRITAVNRGPEAAPLHLLPHVWYRNTWGWGYHRPRPKPELHAVTGDAPFKVHGTHHHIGERWWYAQCRSGRSDGGLLFTGNETNSERLWGTTNDATYVKDGINERVVHDKTDAVNPEMRGTKAAAWFRHVLQPGESWVVDVRFANHSIDAPFESTDETFEMRRNECDDFYASIHRESLSEDERRVQRQAFAGLLWSKQFYHYGVDLWLEGDPAKPPPSTARLSGRNSEWRHFYSVAVMSMPDKWEYPWFAAWDLAFHTLPIAMIDPEWAKRQLTIILREWYMHPNGQIPAYEWNFGDVNPPVHAWAAWRVYEITRKVTGHADTVFLERIYHKLLLNFTWWVNRKDLGDNNVFQGGFLGLDNIGVFDRSKPLPTGGYLEQADGTAWMGMYCLFMLRISLELAKTRPAYEDVATKFFEHFVYIASAINDGCGGTGLWDPEDGFYYDLIHTPDNRYYPVKVRSFVGLIPLLAVEVIEGEVLDMLPRFRRRMEWFAEYRPELVEHISSMGRPGENDRRLLSLVDEPKLRRIMERVLDPTRFLSDYGIRSLSRQHEEEPFVLRVNGNEYKVEYEPAESRTALFGGNSNWRGPIWMPLNYLMIEALLDYHAYYGDSLTIDLPRNSGNEQSLDEVAKNIGQRLTSIFLRDADGNRPFLGDNPYMQADPHWKNHLLFHEYFHGDNGIGLGASHQTGWTALVAELIDRFG